MKPCDKCGSKRVAHISAKCKDLFHARLWHGDMKQIVSEGYADSRWGVSGDSDYVEFDLCMDCGKVQGTFPITDEMLTEDNE